MRRVSIAVFTVVSLVLSLAMVFASEKAHVVATPEKSVVLVVHVPPFLKDYVVSGARILETQNGTLMEITFKKDVQPAKESLQ